MHRCWPSPGVSEMPSRAAVKQWLGVQLARSSDLIPATTGAIKWGDAISAFAQVRRLTCAVTPYGRPRDK